MSPQHPAFSPEERKAALAALAYLWETGWVQSNITRSRGLRRLRFTGLGPIAATDGETSIFYRSVNCLGV
jgi:hypothetical protein